MSLADNAVPIVGNVNASPCYLINYTAIIRVSSGGKNNSSNNKNSKWIPSVLSYNATRTPTSSGGDRKYYWSQALYCITFGFSMCSPSACNGKQCIFDPKNPTCGCLYYTQSTDTTCKNSAPVTLNINYKNDNPDKPAGQMTSGPLTSTIIPILFTVTYQNGLVTLSYNDANGKTLYLTADNNNNIGDSIGKVGLSATSPNFKLSNSELWASIPLNLSFNANQFIPKLAEYGRDCANGNNLYYYEYYESLTYGNGITYSSPQDISTINDMLSTLYIMPSIFQLNCDNTGTTSRKFELAIHDLENYIINNTLSTTARWTNLSCRSKTRFLYCNASSNCGDIASDQMGNVGECNGFCSGGKCTIQGNDDNTNYDFLCVADKKDVPWYKQTNIIIAASVLLGVIILWIVGIIIYLYKHK